MPDQTFAHIAERLRLYFDGLYHGDVATLAEIFHPHARYVSASDEHFVPLAMPEYFERVANRPVPAQRGEVRNDRVVSITRAGPKAALAIVTCTMGARSFVDLLSLVCWGGEWRIIAKVFHYEEIPPAS